MADRGQPSPAERESSGTSLTKQPSMKRGRKKKPGSATADVVIAPGEVHQTPADQEVRRTDTYMEMEAERAAAAAAAADAKENKPSPVVPPKEPVAAQEEIAFPTTIEKNELTTSTTEKDGKTVKETNYQFETREFHEIDPKEYGIEIEEEEIHYEPPERDEYLPDLYRLMATLDRGEGDLESQGEPPSLFSRPENVSNYKKITELKMEMEDDDLRPYVTEFEEGVRDDVIMVGSIELEDVQDEEKRLRDEHVAYQEQEARIQRERQQETLHREEEAKKRVASDLKEKRKIIARREEIVQQRERQMMDHLHKAFRRSENQLVSALERRKGEVKTFYGDLMEADGHYGGSKGRRWKVDWDRTPQPIQVKLKCLRGVKDKLPGGRYVLMVSLHNRLGGHVLRWSNLKGQQWGGATLPTVHDGYFYNTEMKLDQSVFTVLPSRPSIRPGMVLVFELFLLRGAVVPTDRVVGWGAFPISDAQFDIVEGKYKCPFLRGEMDYMIDKHEKIEMLMASDIDHWLCNLYFEIVKLPRYLAGQKEYEVELQFSSGMLAFPDRVNTGEEYRDGEVPVPGSLEEVRSTPSDSRAGSTLSLNASRLLRSNTDLKDKGKKALEEYDDGSKKRSSDESSTDIRQRRPTTTHGSRALHKDKKITAEGDSDASDYDEEDIFVMKKDEDFYPVKGHPGLWYKRHLNNPVDTYHKKLYSLLPKTPILHQRRRRKRMTHLEQLEEHSFAVKKPFSDKGHLSKESWEKVQYVRRQMMAELGLSQWRSREFWGMLLMFIIVFFIRIYVHYIGQWIFLNIIEIPINKFDFLPYTVVLNYQPTLLYTREEMAVVLLGPFTMILLFVLLVITSWIMQRVFGGFPDVGSKFIVSVGIQAFLDPFLILIIDCILQRWQNLGGADPIGDFAKLYWHFYRAEGSGLAGIFITIFLYFFTCFVSGSILYMYFLRLHNNGRMLDIYWRLHGEEDVFFVPYDLEMSNQELAYLCKKAEQWRGEEGERRKVAVYDYVWEEETVEETVWDENNTDKTEIKEGRSEVTTHVSVHTLHLDGLRELYRHFLRLPDGAIVEVFGDLRVPGLDKDVTKALVRGSNNLEQLMGSDVNMGKIHRFDKEDEEDDQMNISPGKTAPQETEA